MCTTANGGGGVLALAEMGSILYGMTHTKQVREGVTVLEATCSENLTAVVDAASMEEKKLKILGFYGR